MWNKIFNKKIFIITLIIGIILIASFFFIGNKVSKNNIELADKTLQENNIEKIDKIMSKAVVIKDRIVYDNNPLVLDGSSLYFDLTYSDGEIIQKDISKLFPLTKYDARIIYPRVLSYIPKQEKVILYRGVDGTEILLDAYVFDIKTGSVKKLNNFTLAYVFTHSGFSLSGEKIALNFGDSIAVFDFLKDKEIGLVKLNDVKNKSFVSDSVSNLGIGTIGSTMGAEDKNFKWLNENLLQYPIYIKVGDSFELEKIETIEVK